MTFMNGKREIRFYDDNGKIWLRVPEHAADQPAKK